MRSIFPALFLAATFMATAAVGEVRDKASNAGLQKARLQTDQQLTQQIKGRMLDARAAFFADISVDVIGGDVLLAGRVRDPKDKPRAAALVRSVPGIQNVVNEIHVGDLATMQQAAEDLDIERRAKFSLLKVFKGKLPRLSWRATDGTVYVFGHAKSEWEHNMALAVIKKTEGVKKVIDHLRIVRNGTAR